MIPLNSLNQKQDVWGSWRPFSGFLGSRFHPGISGIFHPRHGISGIFQGWSIVWDLGFPYLTAGILGLIINLKSDFWDFLSINSFRNFRRYVPSPQILKNSFHYLASWLAWSYPCPEKASKRGQEIALFSDYKEQLGNCFLLPYPSSKFSISLHAPHYEV